MLCRYCGKLLVGKYNCLSCGVKRSNVSEFMPSAQGNSDLIIDDYTQINSAAEASSGRNGCAIAGFIMSFMGGYTVIGLILSIIGLKKAEKTNGNGRGLAIAGLAISLTIITAAVAACLVIFVLPAMGLFPPLINMFVVNEAYYVAKTEGAWQGLKQLFFWIAH